LPGRNAGPEDRLGIGDGKGRSQFDSKRLHPFDDEGSLAQETVLVEKGEKTRLLRDVSLSGKILDTLMHVRMVGSDLRFNGRRCGKAGQLVPVSDGSPHLLVAEATVWEPG